ncbi:acyl-CoA thioesterase [Alkalihalobacterium elongatum]|uniref:acyl-CoA thioesterase n=1 Tax=Alkalihalobacterium elongatum TaxID=2675466 RepID=UPI001C1F23CE|nr:thioesterase family protein [Alkalihalobacterium elongatum]
MKHLTDIHVRFSETDALGHVSNISYFIYFEQARIELIQKVHEVDISQWSFILASTGCNFVNQAYFGKELYIETYFTKIGNKSIQMEQKLYETKTNQLIADSQSVLVYFNFDKQESETIPDFIRDQLYQFYLSG